MTRTCSEGHSEHDELSCVSPFFRGEVSPPKSAQNAPKGLTQTAIPPVPQTERTGRKEPENDTEIYNLTVCRSVTLWRQTGA